MLFNICYVTIPLLNLYHFVELIYKEERLIINKEKLAKIIRIITIPPIMALFLFIVLFIFKDNLFVELADFIAGILFLVVIPTLAYPFQKFIPKFKDKGRDGQRKLAFIVTLLSYTGMLLYVLMANVSPDMLLICLTYFLTVLILTLSNKLHIKASGHAASCSSPLVFFVYYFSWKALIPSVLAFLTILWSSLVTKRHTVKEFMVGSIICIISFAISYVIIF